MKTNFFKNCPVCGDIQSYTTKEGLNRSIREKRMCDKCSRYNRKKNYDENTINKILELYKDGISLTKISLLLKIKKDNVKNILIEKKCWIENRDEIKKNFNNEEIKNILEKYQQGLSSEKIANLYDVSKNPIMRILRDNGMLKKGKSNGIKIELTENQKEIIKKLYLEDYKNSCDIGEAMGLSKSFIDKYLTNCGYRRTRGESISLRQMGKKRSDSVIEILKRAQQKLSKSGKRIQYGGVCSFYLVNNVECQGTYEKFYLEKLISENKKIPEKSKPVITPYGVYNADFYDGNNLIEIKSDYTYDVLVGIKKSRWTNKFDLTQYEKIKWVNENINPVEIFVVDKKNNKLIKKEIK